MKNGSLIFVHNDFKLNDPGTYMSVFIRSALNLDNKGEKVYYNHTANVLEIDGELFVIEAGWNKKEKKAEVIKTNLTQWISKRKLGSFLVKNPTWDFNKSLYRKRLIDSIGKPYDFISVLYFQPIRLAFKKRIWIGNKSTDTFYCSKLCAWAYDLNKWPEQDPEDLYFNKLFI